MLPAMDNEGLRTPQQSNGLAEVPRFFCPREGQISLADAGYLVDPEGSGALYNADVVPASKALAHRCLVLLGEPGMGKSTSLMAMHREAAGTGSSSPVYCNLNQFSSDGLLVQRVFGRTEFEEWVHGTNDLHLFLDSLDECQLRIETIAALLAEQLRGLPTDRLWLRIACRTAVWPAPLEQALQRLMGDVAVMEVAPLRRTDVRTIASSADIDADAFLDAVASARVTAMAIKPVTLRLLLRLFDGGFPETQGEIYWRGCAALCEEKSESRLASGSIGRLSSLQRRAIAARLAAIMTFGQRTTISTTAQSSDTPGSLRMEEAIGGVEHANDQQFAVDMDAVRETLDTGCFVARGKGLMGWAHETYREHLAGRYVDRMDLQQLSSLLLHHDESGRVVPQLSQCAAWVASQRMDVFALIAEKDPVVLLESDVVGGDAGSRFALLATLLKQAEGGEPVDSRVLSSRLYAKLAHPHIVVQLKPYVADRNKHYFARRLAINVAEACGTKPLVQDLIAVALDATDDYRIRCEAASAVLTLGDRAARQQLRPLLHATPDPDDDLLGTALLALWPDDLTAADVCASLREANNSNYAGKYAAFLWAQFPKKLADADLPAVLQWVAQQPAERRPLSRLKQTVDRVLVEAWQRTDKDGVTQALGLAVDARLAVHDEVVGQHVGGLLDKDFRPESTARRSVLREVVRLRGARALATAMSPMCGLYWHEDVPWMVDELDKEPSPAEQRLLSDMISMLVRPDHPHLDLVFLACQRNASLRNAMAFLIDAVELDSPAARTMQEQHEFTAKLERRKAMRVHPAPEARVDRDLSACEAGDVHGWWRLTHSLAMTACGDGDELESDLTLLPGWASAPAGVRVRIVAAARRYLEVGDPSDAEWLGKGILHRPALAGYRALRLLASEASASLDSLPDAVWHKWAASIVAYPVSVWHQVESPHVALVKNAYSRAPDAVLGALRVETRRESDTGLLNTLDKFTLCADDRVVAALMCKASDATFSVRGRIGILEFLFRHGVSVAIAYATDLFSLGVPSDPEQQSFLREVGRRLLAWVPGKGWRTLVPVIQRDREFGRALLSEVAMRTLQQGANIAEILPEEAVADLCLWLEQEFPAIDDPNPQGVHSVGSREAIGDFRNRVLHQLAARGTREACAAIARIERTCPHLHHLRWFVREAREQTLRSGWLPVDPVDLMRLARDKRARLVESGDELLHVVLESLDRLQGRLHGETSTVQFLWNQLGKGRWRPKDENALSDYVKDHVQQDLVARGVVLNREVRIRRGTAGRVGEVTDIHVDAVSAGEQSGHSVVKVIIEAKGCWHAELDSAMKDQLVDRYLKDNDCRHGIYLVGWFGCPGWDETDPRRAQAPSHDITVERRLRAAQAMSLTTGTLRIAAHVLDAGLQASGAVEES